MCCYLKRHHQIFLLLRKKSFWIQTRVFPPYCYAIAVIITSWKKTNVLSIISVKLLNWNYNLLLDWVANFPSISSFSRSYLLIVIEVIFIEQSCVFTAAWKCRWGEGETYSNIFWVTLSSTSNFLNFQTSITEK